MIISRIYTKININVIRYEIKNFNNKGLLKLEFIKEEKVGTYIVFTLRVNYSESLTTLGISIGSNKNFKKCRI